MHRRLLVLPLSLLLTGTALACLNDRDSDRLGNEGRLLPDVVRVTTGRFERNPPLYYQMRIDRTIREIAQYPDRLERYDDVAVAYDRIGKDDAAIDWIERKHRRLRGDPKTGPQHEAWYRYYANVGTFHAHHWLRAGNATAGPLDEIAKAQKEIARAIAIKPDAHFGREKYQLLAIQWIIACRKQPKDSEPFHKYLRRQCHLPDLEIGMSAKTKGIEEAITGLSGLIVLGNAWESIDIFEALGAVVHTHGQQKLAHFADMRQIDLLKAGKTSLGPSRAESIEEAIGYLHQARRMATNIQEVEAKYTELRKEAEEWQKARTAYMIARLQQGQHPDTDPTFWRDYHPDPAPSADITGYAEQWERFFDWWIRKTGGIGPIVTVVTILVLLPMLLFLGIRKLVRYLKTKDR